MFLYFESRHLSHGQKPFPVDPYKAYHLWCLLGVSFRMFPPDVRYHCIFWLLRFFWRIFWKPLVPKTTQLCFSIFPSVGRWPGSSFACVSLTNQIFARRLDLTRLGQWTVDHHGLSWTIMDYQQEDSIQFWFNRSFGFNRRMTWVRLSQLPVASLCRCSYGLSGATPGRLHRARNGGRHFSASHDARRWRSPLGQDCLWHGRRLRF